jgi:hypothetical protein
MYFNFMPDHGLSPVKAILSIFMDRNVTVMLSTQFYSAKMNGTDLFLIFKEVNFVK